MRLPSFLTIARPLNRGGYRSEGDRTGRFSHAVKIVLNKEDRELLNRAAALCDCKGCADFVRQVAMQAAIALTHEVDRDGTGEHG